MFLGQPLLLGLHQPAILAHQLRALDRAGKRPQQRPRRRFGDAAIGVGADFVRQGRHLGRRLGAQHDHRLVVAAGAQAFDELERVEHARLVAHQHGVEHFVAQLGQAGRHADRFFEQRPASALSAANASASQPPVRWSVVTYSTFIRAGIWPQIFGV